MKVLVTGSTGFIGSHCVETLSKRGCSVRCLLRPDSKGTPPSFAETATADYSSVASLTDALSGVDAVVHCGGIVRALRLDDYFKANVQTTENLCRACLIKGIERMVFISSLSAGGQSKADTPRDETMTDEPLTFYGLSKLAAELVVRRLMPAPTCIRPCSVYGPRERDIFTVFRYVAKKGIDLRPKGASPKLSFVHGADVAGAVCASLQSNNTIGKTYYLSDGEVVDWDGFVSHIEGAVSRQAKKVTIPMWSAELYALFGEFYAMVTGRMPIVTREKVFEMSKEAWTCSPNRFISDSGFTPSFKLDEGVKMTAQWYKNEGWL